MSSIHQPCHRRPSLSQDDVSRSAYLESDFPHVQSSMTYEGEPFSYDPARLREWYMKEDLWTRLPASLNAGLVTWQAAGAAVCTALKRIEELEDERLTRGWPEKTRAHLSQTTSKSPSLPHSPSATRITSVPDGASSPKMAVLSTTQVLPASGTYRVRPRNPMGVHTPPLTPTDIQFLTIVSIPKLRTDSLVLGDPELHYHLSTAFTVSTSPPETPTAVFDEAAWTVYTNAYKAELDDLRLNTLVRMRHFGRIVDRVCVKEEIHRTTQADFDTWWLDMTGKIKRCEERAGKLSVSGLEEVREERMQMGMSL
ncbi:hypothetical protein LTR28_010101 [Elasticomyces elasticus]|nr:hypothetical protein LTR28_010101 [Elasticomyces elasticus]